MSRPMRVCLAVFALAVLAPRANGQRQTSSAADLPGQLSPARRPAIPRLGDSVRAVSLPDDQLYAKEMEGVLKGAEDAHILTAVRALASELREARTALGSGVDPADLVAAA